MKDHCYSIFEDSYSLSIDRIFQKSFIRQIEVFLVPILFFKICFQVNLERVARVPLCVILLFSGIHVTIRKSFRVLFRLKVNLKIEPRCHMLLCVEEKIIYIHVLF